MKTVITTMICFISLFSMKTQESFQPIFVNPQIIALNATLKINTCNNKAFVPISLPKNAKGWIYSITEISKGEMQNPSTTLLEEVRSISKYREKATIADFITVGRSKDLFNLYILNDEEQAEAFYHCGCYKYVEKHIGTTSCSGFIDARETETYYIGIEKVKDMKNLRLKVEAIAVL